MTKEELAAQLNGRQYTEEITPEEELLAKRDGLVVIFGASDDLCELCGAINDEVGAYQGATVLIRNGQLLRTIEEDDREVLNRYNALSAVVESYKSATEVKILWCEEDGYSWTVETSAPHATFDIMEDDGKFCRGIVLDLKELEG